MSEFSSFRVDPTLSNLDSCRKNVRENADIFLLVIGGKRGSLDTQSGKSIVNIEYESAVQEALDIYVFVDQAVLNLLPIWQQNSSMSFAPIVDDNAVLSFLQRIREEQRWTFPFTKETDISEILALQLSGQLRDLLAARRAGVLTTSEAFKDEPETVKSLVRSRLSCWEYLITAEMLEARLKLRREELQDIQAGRVLGSHRSMVGSDYLQWVSNKFAESLCTLAKVKHVMEHNFMQAWGAPGSQGNPVGILRAVEEMDRALRALVEIESDIFRTHGPDTAEDIRSALLGMTLDVFDPLDEIPKRLRSLIAQAEGHRESDGVLSLDLTVKFNFTRGDRFELAMETYRLLERTRS